MSKRFKAASMMLVMAHAAAMAQPLPESPPAAVQPEAATEAPPLPQAAGAPAADAAPAPAPEAAASAPMPAEAAADPASAPASLPAPETAAAAPGAPMDGPAAPGKVRFERANYKPGIESLRLVSRGSTAGSIALQVGLSVGLSLLGGGVFVSGSAFSKDDLGGGAVPDLSDPALIANPAATELIAALDQEIAQADARRVGEGQPVPAEEVRLVVNPGPWQLVYETLLEGDETFRLKWGASVVKKGSGSLFRRPVSGSCAYQSAEPASLAAWRANDWQRLREERSRALDDCLRALQPRLPELS